MDQTDFELQNFSAILTQEVDAIQMESPGSAFREAAFTELVMDWFSESGETGNCQVCTTVHQNRAQIRQRQMNGYGIWDDYDTLDLFITNYRGTGEIYTLDKAQVQRDFNLCHRYLKFAKSQDFSTVEESADETGFLTNFAEFADNLLRIRLILITDGIVKSPPPSISTRGEGPSILCEIWDFQRIYQTWGAQGKREPIEIDVPSQFGHHIQCLKVAQPEDGYSAYLGIVPASFLADLYNIFGTRLLQQNVRVYLQNLGKVNKEIRKTILNDPGMFMAYNNGIAATVSEISFEHGTDGTPYIKHIKGLQIVNGGQTTSSIFYARKKDRADLSRIHLQMKITQVHQGREMDDVVLNISNFANSQNKVSEIDLSSNMPFQVKLEELSRTTWVKLADGHGQGRWYYERVKGQYKEELNKEHTNARKEAFKAKNPTRQVLRKDEFAKFRSSWMLLPYWVARGSQKNYLHLLDQQKSHDPTRTHFRQTVAIAILFRKAEELYGKKPYSIGDLRYLVVPYALSWLNLNTHGRLDLLKIWNNQRLSSTLEALLRSILMEVNNFFLTQKPESYALVGEWAKKEDCWNSLIAHDTSGWAVELDTISADLLSQQENEEEHEIVTADALARISSVPLEKWIEISAYGQERLGFNLTELNTLRNLVSRLRRDRPISAQSAYNVSKLLDRYIEARELSPTLVAEIPASAD
ncbi:AIPR family protein [uncultured Pedobacter sp.]|uniref:AIPR family protein n=1 Tax=uncultured Pedobacter sp. TaxID=246139 RepID=UPI0025D79C32|nr:AIPR family protein [uncultured Pedobacter sp.]